MVNFIILFTYAYTHPCAHIHIHTNTHTHTHIHHKLSVPPDDVGEGCKLVNVLSVGDVSTVVEGVISCKLAD